MTGGEKRSLSTGDSPLGPGEPDPAPAVSIPPEPFAVISSGAAIAGLALVLVRKAHTRLLGASIAGAVGVVALLLLALSPTLRALGLSAVTLLFGFYVTLGLFAVAVAIHVLQLRAESRG